jgi:hypothetical protein
VVREVGVHDDDEVAGCELQAVDVRCAEAELAGARLEEDVWGVGFCELVGDDLGAVGGAVVDDYELPVEVAVWVGMGLVRCCGRGVGRRGERSGKDVQLGEGAVEEPGYDGEVAALVVGWEEDGVFIF